MPLNISNGEFRSLNQEPIQSGNENVPVARIEPDDSLGIFTIWSDANTILIVIITIIAWWWSSQAPHASQASQACHALQTSKSSNIRLKYFTSDPIVLSLQCPLHPGKVYRSTLLSFQSQISPVIITFPPLYLLNLQWSPNLVLWSFPWLVTASWPKVLTYQSSIL